MANSDETARVLSAYAKAWLASDLEKVLALYHDDIELHYMGESRSLEHIVGVMQRSLFLLRHPRVLLAD